jgi:hypothetical protein
VPRLIALHPSIDLSKTRDWHDLKLVLQVGRAQGHAAASAAPPAKQVAD